MLVITFSVVFYYSFYYSFYYLCRQLKGSNSRQDWFETKEYESILRMLADCVW